MGAIYKYSSPEELTQLLDKTQPVFFDTETSKLGSQMRIMQVYQEHWKQVLIFTDPRIWFFLADGCHLVGHNIIYDFGVLQKDLGGAYTAPSSWDDTFYLSRLAFPSWNTGKGYSLDAALTSVLGYDPYAKAGINKKELQMSFERIKVKGEYVEGPTGLKPLTDKQLLYASIDVYELPKLYKAVKHMQDHFVYTLDKDTVDILLTDTLGMPVDFTELEKIRARDIATIAELTKSLNGMNVNSYMQVRKALGTQVSSNEIALRIIENRPRGLEGHWSRIRRAPQGWPKALKTAIDDFKVRVQIKSFGKSTDISSSTELPNSDKQLVYVQESSYVHSEEKANLATKINTVKKCLKRLNFVDRAYSAVGTDGRIKATFSPHAINGRIQQNNENLTQYPRAMKRMWGHPVGSGRKLMYCDFAQIELRIICAALPEMNMYKAFKEGKDPHSFVAESFNFTDEEIKLLPVGQSPRQVAKQANFLLLYGGGETNFQQVVCRNSGVWFSEEAVHKIVSKWKGIFSDITKWQAVNSRSVSKMDKTIGGRPYKAATVTDLNNIRVSGTGAEIFKLWLYYINKYIVVPSESVFVVNRVHDSVMLDVPDDPAIYEPMAQLLAKLGQIAWFEITSKAPLTDVPMPVEVAVGSNLGDIEAGKADYVFNLEPYYMYERSIEDVL